MAYEYPTDQEFLDAASIVLDLVKGEIPRTQDAVKAVYVAAGFVLGKLFPPGPAILAGIEGVETSAQLEGAELKDALASAMESVRPPVDGVLQAPQKAIPWGPLFMALLKLLALLKS